jgi:hypothetical protein
MRVWKLVLLVPLLVPGLAVAGDARPASTSFARRTLAVSGRQRRS